jgi:peptide/nickel transport system permease protein
MGQTIPTPVSGASGNVKALRTHTHPRARSVLQQVLWALLTLLLISVITFFGTSLRSPQELAKTSLGRNISAAQVDLFIETHGLDKPVVLRYAIWLGKAVRGDFGTSLLNEEKVSDQVLPRAWRTLTLSLATMVLAVPIGIGLGVFTARRWGGRIDLSTNVSAIVLSAFPEFVVGLILLWLFAVVAGWLPVDSGSGIAFGSLSAQLKAYVLPTLTLVAASVPFIMRNTRVAAHEALVAPYTRAAVLRGLPRRNVVWNHAMRNAASPITNAVAINLVYLLGGVIVVENLFAFPGLGQGLVAAVSNGDAPAVQAIAILMGAMFIVISVAADILSVLFNPRLKQGSR